MASRALCAKTETAETAAAASVRRKLRNLIGRSVGLEVPGVSGSPDPPQDISPTDARRLRKTVWKALLFTGKCNVGRIDGRVGRVGFADKREVVVRRQGQKSVRALSDFSTYGTAGELCSFLATSI